MASKRLSVLLRSTSEDLEEKDNNMFVDEKIERPTILSRLFSFPKEPKTRMVVNEVQSDIGGKRSRQLSQLLRSTKEEESSFNDHREDTVPDGKKEINKRTRRFSSLFAGTSADSIEEDFSLSDERDEAEVSKERDDIATMVFQLFHVRNPRNASKHKRNVSTRSAASFKPRQQDKSRKGKNGKKQLTIKLFWRSKDGSQTSKNSMNADALSLTPTVVKRSKKTRHRATSVCDSKFSSISSISSALSFTSQSLPHELLSITADQCSILLHLLPKVSRSLQNQERLTANFSTNLAHLFARKERAIDGNKRLGKETRKMLLGMMSGLRELVGRTFLKKGVFLQRSLQLVHELQDMLSRRHIIEPLVPNSNLRLEGGGDSETTLWGTLLPAESIAITISELNASAITLPVGDVNAPEPEHHVDIHLFLHTLQMIHSDISVQRQLDLALHSGIVGPCEDVRFPAGIGERIALRRFVAFLDGCFLHLERRYAQESRVVKVLECLGGVLEDGA